MGVLCKDLIVQLERIAPEYLAEDWDNVGLQVGRLDKDIDKILVTLDVTKEIIVMAIREKVDIIIAHHPLIFKGIKKVTTEDYLGSNIQQLIKSDISVYAMHTNIDISKHGLATKLAEKLDLKHLMILKEDKDEQGVVQGIGRVGELPKPISFETLVDNLKSILKCDIIRYAGNKDINIRKVAICPGSGMDYMKQAHSKDADVYITGDLKHHQALEVQEMDFLVIDASHYYTEKIFEEIIHESIEGYAHQHRIEILVPYFEESPIKYL
ncbi:MAG TPA: Nif3-like dinuclear metal center hexameric protein [Clostridiales bacterium]|nr:MAG: Nif3-like dinuclear metal center hexameric protein [Clostridiales bacterium GWD2_32_59]HAN09960.1 Nif3-like dinuclear metal center hexameric protein [Clostridiales bacterium]